WHGSSDSLPGTPLVKHDEVWTLEMLGRNVYTGERTAAMMLDQPKDPPANRFALVRHRPVRGAADEPAARDEILKTDLGDGGIAGDFAPSPDGSTFLLAVNRDQRPRLLFIPIKPSVEERDVTTVELVGAGGK